MNKYSVLYVFIFCVMSNLLKGMTYRTKNLGHVIELVNRILTETDTTSREEVAKKFVTSPEYLATFDELETVSDVAYIMPHILTKYGNYRWITLYLNRECAYEWLWEHRKKLSYTERVSSEHNLNDVVDVIARWSFCHAIGMLKLIRMLHYTNQYVPLPDKISLYKLHAENPDLIKIKYILCSAISRAVQHHESEATLKNYIRDHSIDLNVSDYNGETPLHWAVKSPYVRKKEFYFLVEVGANVNARDNEGCTPLHRCIIPILYNDRDYEYQPLTPLFLFKNNADISIKNIQGKTPLALLQDKIKEWKILLQKLEEQEKESVSSWWLWKQTEELRNKITIIERISGKMETVLKVIVPKEALTVQLNE